MNYLKRTNEMDDIEQDQFPLREQNQNRSRMIRYCPLGHILELEEIDLCVTCKIKEMEVYGIPKRRCDTCHQILFYECNLCEYCLKGYGLAIAYKNIKNKIFIFYNDKLKIYLSIII